MEWTKEDSEMARKEGWDLYFSEGSMDGDWQVQKNDDQKILPDDATAWKIVKSQKHPHHIKALELLKDHNPDEYNRIINH